MHDIRLYNGIVFMLALALAASPAGAATEIDAQAARSEPSTSLALAESSPAQTTNVVVAGVDMMAPREDTLTAEEAVPSPATGEGAEVQAATNVSSPPGSPVRIIVAMVPEPASLLLLMSGLLAFAYARSRQVGNKRDD